jgi:hypothetical protein
VSGPSPSSATRLLTPYPLPCHGSKGRPLTYVGDRSPSQFPSDRSRAALGSDQRLSKANNAGTHAVGDVRRATLTLPLHPTAQLPSSPSQSISADVRQPPPGNSTTVPDIVVQHWDGGAVVQELPPPYHDHSVSTEL